MASPVIFQIAGFKNSGKTFLMEQLIRSGTELGYRVGALKHHGHGGEPSHALERTDSARHKHAGAYVSAVEGGGALLLESESFTGTGAELPRILSSFHLDYLFIEGYKHTPFPKAVLVNSPDDFHLIPNLENIKAVIYKSCLCIPACEAELFTWKETDAFVSWLFEGGSLEAP